MNKSKMFCFRLSERDYLSIQRKADKAKLNMTAYITTSALNKQITVIDGLELVISELKAIGRNINQLTTLCNMGKIQSLELADIKERFGKIFDAIMALCERSEGSPQRQYLCGGKEQPRNNELLPRSLQQNE